MTPVCAWQRPSPHTRLAGQHGFTLLELLVVIVIIGLLAAFVGPRYFSHIGKSERKAAQAQIEAFARALEAYRLDMGHFPSNEEGLKALVERPANEPKWSGPYLQKAPPLDPWGKPYVYQGPGGDVEFNVLSWAKDGQPGGSGDGQDIGYR